jgi:hypothetical protein
MSNGMTEGGPVPFQTLLQAAAVAALCANAEGRSPFLFLAGQNNIHLL